MLDARDTLARSNFMRTTALLILIRGTKPLCIRNCGRTMTNRLFSCSFDDIPELDLGMSSNNFFASAVHGPPHC